MTTTAATAAPSSGASGGDAVDDMLSKSPRSMAEAAIAQAMSQHAAAAKAHGQQQQRRVNKRDRRSENENSDQEDDEDDGGVNGEQLRPGTANGSTSNHNTGTGAGGGLLAIDGGSDDQFGLGVDFASPNALETGRGGAEAAMVTAKRRRRGGQPGKKGGNDTFYESSGQASKMHQAELRLEEAWKNHVSSSSSSATAAASSTGRSDSPSTVSDLDVALSKTETILLSEIEGMIQSGIQAFHDRDAAVRELAMVKELADSRGKEVQRLQESERQSREAVSNLLRAVEAAKSDSRSASRHVQVEARLRGECTTLRSERDAALAEAAESKRRAALAEEECRTSRAKLTRLAQERTRLERDFRASLSLAKSLDSDSSGDSSYYKRRSEDLQEKLNKANATVAEQKGQIAELHRQRERTMSQNQLSQMREGRR